MNLTVGKRYICRDTTEIVYVKLIEKTDNIPYPFVGEVYYRNQLETSYVTYTAYGKQVINSIQPLDLVSEYEGGNDEIL